MPKQGLTKESVVQAANQLIEESGMVRFSMAKLAQRLHIKTASLYNHVESLEKLLEYVGEDAVSQLVGLENQAIAGKAQDAALFALAEAYRTFAREHSELYRVIMSFPKWRPDTGAGGWQNRRAFFASFVQLWTDKNATVSLARVLRAVMSGFAFHEQAGGFAHFPVNQDESFRIAMQCVANGLHEAGSDKP